MNKKMILMLLIILSIIIIAILGIIIFNKLPNNSNSENEVSELDIEIKEPIDVNDSTLFFSVKQCINKYIVSASDNDKEAIFLMLDKEYISKNNITKDNVFEYVKGIELDDKVSIRQMKMFVEGDIAYYYVLGKLLNTETKKYKDFYITVIVNGKDMTFAIIPNQDGFPEGVFKEEGNG